MMTALLGSCGRSQAEQLSFLMITEVMPGNHTAVSGASGQYDDWLEITNTVPLADGNYFLVRRHVLGDYPYPDARGTSEVFAEYIYTGYNAENTAVWQFASPVRVEMP